MAAQRTYRVQAERAPKLVFDLSRMGSRLETARQSTALFQAPAGSLEVRTTRDRRVLGSRTGDADHVVDVGTGPLEELLENVGLRRQTTYVNERERYSIGGAIISLEHVIPLGWFCVITAEHIADVDALAARLHLVHTDIERRDYSRLVIEMIGASPPSTSRAALLTSTVLPSTPPASAPRPQSKGPTPKSPPAVTAPTVDQVRAPRSEPAPKKQAGGGGRAVRLLLILLVCGLLAVLVDLTLGALLLAVLLLLEWALGGRRPPSPVEGSGPSSG